MRMRMRASKSACACRAYKRGPKSVKKKQVKKSPIWVNYWDWDFLFYMRMSKIGAMAIPIINILLDHLTVKKEEEIF